MYCHRPDKGTLERAWKGTATRTGKLLRYGSSKIANDLFIKEYMENRDRWDASQNSVVS